jgi:hypothetical protein
MQHILGSEHLARTTYYGQLIGFDINPNYEYLGGDDITAIAKQQN